MQCPSPGQSTEALVSLLCIVRVCSRYVRLDLRLLYDSIIMWACCHSIFCIVSVSNMFSTSPTVWCQHYRILKKRIARGYTFRYDMTSEYLVYKSLGHESALPINIQVLSTQIHLCWVRFIPSIHLVFNVIFPVLKWYFFLHTTARQPPHSR